MKHARIIEEIHRHQWAITPAGLEAIVRIVTVGEELEDPAIFHGSIISVEDREAELSAAYPPARAEEVPYNFGQKLGNIGVINIDGPTIPRNAGQPPSQPKLTTMQGLMEDFQRTEDDPEIDRRAMFFDTPGGAVTLTSEFAAMIANSKKPTVAYVEGHAASAGFWLASACDSIIAANTANVGSVGVVGKISTNKDKDSVEITSSQSEFKNADPNTDEGKAVFQRMVDDTADVFINAVAENRGTTREDVLENYGKGSIVIASRAKAKGMIDAVMTRAQFMQEFSGDLEGVSWMKGTQQATAENQKVDISTEHVELKDKNTAPSKAVTNPKEGAKTMDLEQFLKENPAAKAEYLEAIAKAETDACDCLRKDMAQAAEVAASDYPAPVKAIAVDVIAGKRTPDTLAAVMTVAEMEKEKTNSDAAKVKTKKIGDTPPDDQPLKSADGKIRTTADYMAAVGRKEEI